ncbi:hypothetical protein ACHAWF_008329 [Thalassiosira exigua]
MSQLHFSMLSWMKVKGFILRYPKVSTEFYYLWFEAVPPILLSNLDPCLFVGEKVIAVVFIDDILFWEDIEKDIHNFALNLCEIGVDLEQEEDALGFLEL